MNESDTPASLLESVLSLLILVLFLFGFFKFFRLAEAVCDIRDIAMQMTVTHKEGTKK